MPYPDEIIYTDEFRNNLITYYCKISVELCFTFMIFVFILEPMTFAIITVHTDLETILHISTIYHNVGQRVTIFNYKYL